MWTKWLPWRLIVRSMARKQGFLDPIKLISNLQRFSQPSEVMAPTELLRAGAVLQARGLMNGQAIQHNLDWIWPYWVERQFDPRDDAFVPRAFNITHINLTHRNWTAVGIPDFSELPLVDPRGLVTPLFDGWSLESWVVTDKMPLITPSRLEEVDQHLLFDPNFAVETMAKQNGATLESKTEVVQRDGQVFCQIRLKCTSHSRAWLVVSLRPYNPEGVSFVHDIELLPNPGWKVNKHDMVSFDKSAWRYVFSNYKNGDVSRLLFDRASMTEKIDCAVGMATAAALFGLEPRREKEVLVSVQLGSKKKKPGSWSKSLENHCQLKIPDKRFQFLYDAAIRTLVLHSPGRDVYPGPYTYKRFWFRDAAFILHAMLCVGLNERVERVLDYFPNRQTPFGYFLSQEGEWDSNGEALWIFRRFCELTGQPAKEVWRSSILRAGRWIQRKRLSNKLRTPHAGLLPAGFSAEHLGPNDYYYWDDFWGLAGLEAAAYLARSLGDQKSVEEFEKNARDFSQAIDKSIAGNHERLNSWAIPASPYRRLDSGSIGCLAAGYPLKLWGSKDRRSLETADFLMEQSFVSGGFFQEISHSGINPYLTLHVAQILLRAGDRRYLPLAETVADLASSTGQWPEAIHPRTRGGCMGDGQHVWATAEWVLMIRNFFVREEEAQNKLILCSGIPNHWYKNEEAISFGPTQTSYGRISIEIKSHQDGLRVSWTPEWHGAHKEPHIEIHLPGLDIVRVEAGKNEANIRSHKPL